MKKHFAFWKCYLNEKNVKIHKITFRLESEKGLQKKHLVSVHVKAISHVHLGGLLPTKIVAPFYIPKKGVVVQCSFHYE